MIFILGAKDISKTAQFTPNKGSKGENFYVFQCNLLVLKGVTQCAVVTDSPNVCQFAYSLSSWTNAVP